ncbi:MAG: ferredoxin [Gemmatimonadetes bacterium]|nr:ferredoxin [Gemmatimonadota bacterium]
MAHFEERRIGTLTFRIDRLICVGFGDCIEASPGAFELDQDGIAVFKEGSSALAEAELIAACKSCPVDAIQVWGPNGEPLVP